MCAGGIWLCYLILVAKWCDILIVLKEKRRAKGKKYVVVSKWTLVEQRMLKRINGEFKFGDR